MKNIKNFVIFNCILLLLLLAFSFSSPPSGFKWTGAWQPTRISAGDGVTALSTKIGNFITLPDKESYAHVIFNVNNRFPGQRHGRPGPLGIYLVLRPQAKVCQTRLMKSTYPIWIS